jgi:AcrR family transcriptional regulator
MMRSRKPSSNEASGPGAGKPLRADARQNRERILRVAEAIFAAKGTSASTNEIAQKAKVGIGTIFRHFPTKETLIKAIVVSRLRRLTDEAYSLCAAADPGAAFFEFFTHAVDQAATTHAFANALADADVIVKKAMSQVEQDIQQAIETLLTRAQQAGAVRDDIRVGELISLMIGTSRAVEHAGWDRHVQARILAVVFDGLRPVRNHSQQLVT